MVEYQQILQDQEIIIVKIRLELAVQDEMFQTSLINCHCVLKVIFTITR